jgi:hypothetical protein
MTAATAPATMTAASARASSSTTAAFALRTSFIHNKRATHKILAIERLNRLFRLRIIADFGKAESPWLAGETIAKKGELIGLHSNFRE